MFRNVSEICIVFGVASYAIMSSVAVLTQDVVVLGVLDVKSHERGVLHFFVGRKLVGGQRPFRLFFLVA